MIFKNNTRNHYKTLNCKILNAVHHLQTQDAGYLPLKFNLFLEILANTIRQNQMNGANTGKEVKAISLFADNWILNLENSEALTERKPLWTNFFKKQPHKDVTM